MGEARGEGHLVWIDSLLKTVATAECCGRNAAILP
jgi:hypothetical protein